MTTAHRAVELSQQKISTAIAGEVIEILRPQIREPPPPAPPSVDQIAAAVEQAVEKAVSAAAFTHGGPHRYNDAVSKVLHVLAKSTAMGRHFKSSSATTR